MTTFALLLWTILLAAAAQVTCLNAAAGEWTSITIIGENSVTGAEVTIGGVPATDVFVDSITEITAKTPPGPAKIHYDRRGMDY